MSTTPLIHDYPHRMGGHCGSGALRDLMHWHGLGWDGPPDEGLVFTLGGALGLSYVRSNELMPPVYLVGRGSSFEIDLPRRLGGEVAVLTTDDPEEGWDWVRHEVDAGRPSLIWGDIAELPYLRVKLQMSRHDVVVIGYDTERGIAHVVDNDRAEVQEVPLDALARARSSVSFPEPTRHCTYKIEWPSELPSLGAVAADAFQQSAARMRQPSGPGIIDLAASGAGAEGLDGVALLASDVRGWADLPSGELELLLLSLGAFIEKAGTGGGLFRRLLANGCRDVARLTGDEATSELADVADRCATAWTKLAKASTNREADLLARAHAAAIAADDLPTLEASVTDALEVAALSLAHAAL